MPTVFIGSSTEGLEVARAIRSQLSETAEVTIWNEGVFGLGSGTLEHLVGDLHKYDFAVLVLTPDDMTESRNSKEQSPRDNVLFECGLFMGRLGRESTFLVYDRTKELKLPSDLAGTTLATYRGEREDKNTLAAVGEACDKIRVAIERSTSRVRAVTGAMPARRVEEVLERGSPRFLDVLVDGAVYVADTAATFHEGLKKSVLSNRLLPMKYLYCTDDGCEFWLEICRKPEYAFYSSSIAQLEAVATDISGAIKRVTGSTAVDWISLGSGNGEKDNRLLRELCQRLEGDGIIYYYPLDINAQMLVQAVRGAMPGVDRNRIKVKALIGDLTRIHQLRPVYEDRANVNVFSVLGNTLGNSDENQILRAVQEAMLPGDLLLLEVNIRASGLEAFLKDELNMRHDFVPLQSLGVPFDRGKMKYEQQQDLSVVPKTISTVARYSDATVAGRTVKNIGLSVIHHYDPDSILEYLSRNLDVNVVFDSRHEDVGLFLLQRPLI